MKKISVLSVVAVLAMPAIAVEDVHKMYGKEPVETVPQEIVAQYEQQVKKADINEEELAPETKEIQKVEDVEKIEKIKKVKIVEETEEAEEPKYNKENKESKFKEPSNPKARFPHGVQLGVGVSPTTGLNGFIGYNNKNFNSFWAKRFGIRFDFATYSPIKSALNKKINNSIDDKGFEIEDSLRIDNFKLNAKHYGAMIDFYPFGNTWFLGGLRLSGGYFAGKLDLDADIHGNVNGDKIEFELDGKTYSYDGTQMHGKAMIDWKFNGPYLGTGFDLGLFWGIKMFVDAGVVFTGSTAKIDLDIPLNGLKDELGTAITEGSPEYNQFIQDKNKALADARKEIKDYPYYPIVKLGLMYRF